jgi:hypothetical protein
MQLHACIHGSFVSEKSEKVDREFASCEATRGPELAEVNTQHLPNLMLMQVKDC